ncbi:glycerol-3-phosphate 1-O-acyltransferase PlsY [Novosphingobium sp.]|uniref:glycerol-3-phosphate 1-O-acyltransferase PlsY n=1 Tax=Novosphingobium sp. TaxID=1874826 RepID=UPI0035AFA9B8
MESIYALALGYLLGSVPFGLILTQRFGAGDLRTIGSGNIGATNVLRTGRKELAAATLLLDLLKGLAAVWLAQRWWPAAAPVAALGAVLGHCFPVWLGFKGGKGVATTMGVVLGLAWQLGLVYAATWLVMLAITRISSLSGMTAVIAVPVAAWLLGRPDLVAALGAIAALVVVLHRANIGRLLSGTEPRVGSKGK